MLPSLVFYTTSETWQDSPETQRRDPFSSLLIKLLSPLLPGIGLSHLRLSYGGIDVNEPFPQGQNCGRLDILPDKRAVGCCRKIANETRNYQSSCE